MGDLVATFKGTSGQAELYSDKLMITRKGIMAKLNTIGKTTSSGDQTIFLDQITSIEIDKGVLTCGIVFLTTGPSTLFGVTKGTKAREDKKIEFNRTDMKTALAFKESVETTIMQFKKGGNTVNITSGDSSADKIKKLKELLDMGAISKDEFEVKKKELLKDL